MVGVVVLVMAACGMELDMRWLVTITGTTPPVKTKIGLVKGGPILEKFYVNRLKEAEECLVDMQDQGVTIKEVVIYSA